MGWRILDALSVDLRRILLVSKSSNERGLIYVAGSISCKKKPSRGGLSGLHALGRTCERGIIIITDFDTAEFNYTHITQYSKTTTVSSWN